MIFLLLGAILLLAVCFYLDEVYSTFIHYGIKHHKPIPLVGNMMAVITRKCHMAENLAKTYFAFPDERFTGKYDFLTPALLIHDLELIKQITIKNFESFLDHRSVVDEEMEPCFGRSLFSLKGQEWKDMRSTLTPAFTSSKMRAMVPLMKEVNEQMIRVLKANIENSKGCSAENRQDRGLLAGSKLGTPVSWTPRERYDGYIHVECKELMNRYANDVIASCAFGVKVDSHSNKNNEFYTNGKKIGSFGFRALLVVLGYQSFPKLMKKLKVRLFPKKATKFFETVLQSNMKKREHYNISRPDMIHLLVEAKKGTVEHEDKVQISDTGYATMHASEYGRTKVNRDWSDSDLMAQAVAFFLAGFESVSAALAALMYELALNPDIQERLVQEIKDNDQINNGNFDYNSIQNLKYLDMVISEVLRLWPPVFIFNRECTKEFNIGKANEKAPKEYVVRKGEAISFPVWCIHRDPRHYPNPDRFDPERFSDKNKGNIKSFSYLPFGVGPRNCIGSRFALCEMKVMAYQMLQQLELSPCDRTTIPPQLDPSTFSVKLKGGFWLKITARK